jgi:hypothetical protein
MLVVEDPVIAHAQLAQGIECHVPGVPAAFAEEMSLSSDPMRALCGGSFLIEKA